jgi:phosphoenolpyruvate carboxykinase (GTP)
MEERHETTKNRALTEWVAEIARLTTPDQIAWCDGSEAERDRLTALGSGLDP